MKASNVNAIARRASFESLERRLCLSVTDIDPTFGSAGLVTPTFAAGASRGGVTMADDGDLLMYRTLQTAPNNYVDQVADIAPDGTVRWVGQVPNSPRVASLDAGALVRQPDGKVVVASEQVFGISGDSLLSRLNADGTTDASYNPALPGGGGMRDYITALNAPADGTILVAQSGEDFQEFGIEQIAADGSVQKIFATNGRFLSSKSEITALAEQSDGKIVAAGFADRGRRHLVVERFNTDGSPDTTFGDAGVLITNLRLAPTRLIIDASGRLLVLATPNGQSGFSFNSGLGQTPTLIAITSAGQLDSSFGSGGIVSDPGGLDQLMDFREAGDGSFYVAGTQGRQPAVVHLDANGANLEKARGSDIVTGDSVYFPFIAVTTDGKLVTQPTTGTLQRSVGLSQAQNTGDDVSPSVTLGRLRRVIVGASTYSVTVAYTDVQTGVDTQTLGRTNAILRVAGKSPIRAASASVTHRGSTWTVVYTFNAPGGTWGPEDAGRYTVQIVGSQVTDNAGTAVEGIILGGFTIPSASFAAPAVFKRKDLGDD